MSKAAQRVNQTRLSLDESRRLALVADLLQHPESQVAEFKLNNVNPQKIGVYISALSNAARLADQHFGYLLWGVRDEDRQVVGTNFDPGSVREQAHPLEFWLAQRLRPSIPFSFKEVAHPEGRLLLLEIPASTESPVEFDGHAYVRIGSATPKLSDHPERQRALWDRLRPYFWEQGIAAQFLNGSDVLQRLDWESYFQLTDIPQTTSQPSILDRLTSDGLIARDVGDRWNITNLGAILFARRLTDFEERLSRKGVRFIAYQGNSRADTVTHRQDENRGYANGFADLIEYINNLLPKNESIGHALRTQTTFYPSIAIRELVANALIHQDMTITGAGPLIELFRNRLEITNPGQPLINPERFLDSAPRSRNEVLASLMRRMGMCEEQGTGVDKILTSIESFQLPAPDFRVEDQALRAILYAPRKFAELTADERIRACYQHAALRYLSGERMKNSTLRERFGIEPQNAAQVSQVIRQTLALKLIRPADPERPQAAYLPYWA